MIDTQPRTPGRIQRAIYYLRTEGSTSPAHDAWAIGLGLFIGCSPLIGLHLALCLLAGWAFGLNKVKLYLAANLINPLIMPAVLFAEVQAGSWLRRGHGYPIAMDAFHTMDPWHFGQDLFVGSVLVGGVLGGVVGLLTLSATGRARRDPIFGALVKVASDRYLGSGITAWEFARAKLRNDPVYRQVVTTGLVPAAGRVLDVGCGQGLLLAILAAARDLARAGEWPAEWAAAPREAVLTGVELRPRIAQIAREALADAAIIQTADARVLLDAAAAATQAASADAGAATDAPVGERQRPDVVALFDVLHLTTAEDQERLLASIVAALSPGGRLLVREADAAAGWRFNMVRFGNRVTALVQRRWRAAFHFRTATEWRALLERHGLRVEVLPMGTATFANVLMVATKPPR